MYSKSFPFKDFKGQPRNQKVYFNLTEREVFKLLVELKAIFDWRESMSGEERELQPEEVVEFYNHFETVLLAAYGVPSDDGLHFRKASRYDFEESALFNACMVEFVSNPPETGKLIDGILPSGMGEIVKNADANLLAAANNPDTSDTAKAQLVELRARLIAQGLDPDAMLTEPPATASGLPATPQ